MSLVLLPLFEVEANRETGTYYGDRIFGALATQLRTSTWVPALLALGFATGFIHYLLDRSVYRMSDPRVRAAARGLVGNASRIAPRKMVRRFALVFIGALASFSSLHAQTGTPVAAQQPPKAIYTPKPVYRPEWAKQGLAGKGIVLVTILFNVDWRHEGPSRGWGVPFDVVFDIVHDQQRGPNDTGRG